MVIGIAILILGASRPAGIPVADAAPTTRSVSLAGGRRETLMLGEVKTGETYRLIVTFDGGRMGPHDRVRVGFAGSASDSSSKELHAGDPDLYLPYRPSHDGRATLTLSRNPGTAAPFLVRVEWAGLPLSESDRAAIEAEPNDSWQQANPLVLGRDVYGSADDVDYLENPSEGRSGIDWFRFELTSDKPILVYFQLDLLDRDVSANLRVYTIGHEERSDRALPPGQGPDGDRP